MTGRLLLGPPGRLVTLPNPDPGTGRILEVHASVLAGANGGRTVDAVGNGRRTWVFTYTGLTITQADPIAALRAGLHGPAPLALLDPTHPNRFSADQSTGGSITKTTTGFAPTAPDTVAVCAAHTVTGGLALAWTTTPGSVRALRLPSAWPTFGDAEVSAFPVQPGTTVHLSAAVYAPASLPAAWNLAAFKENGAAIGDHTTPATTTAPDAWTTVAGAVAVPPTAAWVAPTLTLDTTSVMALTTVHLDALAMTYGAPLPAWRAGAGVPLVTITTWDARHPWFDTVNGTLRLTEVGR